MTLLLFKVSTLRGIVRVNKQGNMVINNADIKMNSMKIDIRFIMPRVYKILLIISFISILFMLIPVIRSYRRE